MVYRGSVLDAISGPHGRSWKRRVLLYMYLSSELEPQVRQRTTEGTRRKFVCRLIPGVTSPQATLSQGNKCGKS